MMEPADLCKRHDLSGSAGLYSTDLGLDRRLMAAPALACREVSNVEVPAPRLGLTAVGSPGKGRNSA
jgi:hypothetical protein